MSRSPPLHSANYSKLHEHLKKASLLEAASGLLSWDMETYMPSGSGQSRSEQKAYLSELAHHALTCGKYKGLLQKLIDLETGHIQDHSLPVPIQDSLRQLRLDFLKQSKLPAAFVKRWSSATSAGIQAWKVAKKNSSFKEFLPHLKKIIDLSRKKADLLGYDVHPYDALLDLFEPGTTVASLTPLFQELRIGLVQLLKRIPVIDTRCMQGHFPHDLQKKFSKTLLPLIGIPSDQCRLDESSHPFCNSFHPTDVRLTTRILEDRVISAVSTVLHEAGHGLYENQLDPIYHGTPLGQACSMAIHESQSRFFEVFLGKSLPFWKYLYPKFQEAFAPHFNQVPLEEFYRAIHFVAPSLIRVESDEVTYNLHVMVRFECEKGLIEGSLKPQDVPEFWNDKMQQYLGIIPPNDAVGCLQDIHWSMGGIGYFPTYTMGNLAGAALFEKLQQEHPNWQSLVEKGDLGFVKSFLYTKIHRHGRRFSSHELLKQAIGEDFQTKSFFNHLDSKYQLLENLKS